LKDISAMLLQKAKLTLVDYALISEAVPLNMLAERWEELKEKFALLPYPMDGIVLKFADEQFRRELGNTAHHPRGEIAYKFTNRSAQSCLLGVEWSFGKNCLTPVALLEPVDISGITIKRASLHNAQNLLDMDLKIGDTVTVERAGDVIPFIAAREPGHERRDPFITDCPACGSKVVRKGPELCCGNPDCPGAKLQLLTAAVRNLGIERLGEPTVAKLIAHCGVRSLRDLFELTENDIMKIDGFGEKSAANLIGEIRKAREVDDFQLVAALNIPNVGVNIAKLMLEKYSFEELRNLPESELANISGIGPERAAAVAKAMQERQAELDELLAAVSLRRSEKSGDEPTICFTGKMPEKRSYYEKLARERGFRAVDSVTAALTLLVAADINENSTKLRNARKHGVQIMPLAEFLSGNSEKAPGSEPEENLFGDLPLFS
jgi:DNA ligase (NAD+)